ncbi:MAG TPA: hypothetical protein VIS47_03175 [Nitrosopumilus sp.]
MEIHQKLTVVGLVLLIVTFLINYYHQENHSGIGFNYAYVTGVAMLIAFSISFVMFTKNQLK